MLIVLRLLTLRPSTHVKSSPFDIDAMLARENTVQVEAAAGPEGSLQATCGVWVLWWQPSRTADNSRGSVS